PVRTHDYLGADSELGVSDPVQMCGKPGSNSEPSRDSGVRHSVRNPNSARTVRTDTNTCISTVPRARDVPLTALDWPDSLRLNPGDRRNVTQALSALAPEERQAILAEAGARCASGGIRRPAAYLIGLIKRATRGE